MTVSGSAKTVLTLTVFNVPAASTGQTRHFNDAGEILCKAGFAGSASSVMKLTPTVSGTYVKTVVVSTKDSAPGIVGAAFSALGNPIVTNSDHAAFQATVTGSVGSCVVSASPNTVHLVLTYLAGGRYFQHRHATHCNDDERREPNFRTPERRDSGSKLPTRADTQDPRKTGLAE